MKQIYQSIWIELPYPVVQVVDVNMTEGMNCHACMQITAICEDEKQEELLNQSVEHKIVQAGFLKEGAEKECCEAENCRKILTDFLLPNN